MDSQIPCALCTSTETRPIIKKFDHYLARCNSCGLVYANPRVPREAILARYSPAYFRDEYLPAHGVKDGVYDLTQFDARHGPTLSLIQQTVGSVGKLFEVGTGAGFFLKSAQRAGWDVYGIEISEEAVSFAQAELGLKVVKMAAEELNYPANEFDAVVMFEVIEHLFEPHRVLEMVQRMLRPGGALVISTPNFNALSRIGLGNNWAVLSPGEHLYYFTEQTLSAMLAATGFERVQFRRRFPGWGVLQAMNPNYTHAPHSRRTKLYHWFVATIGFVLYRWILAQGWGDTLLCVARKPAEGL